jgi:DNA modification methylase
MIIELENNKICLGDALSFYKEWAKPDAIVCDGPYGVAGYEGDLKNVENLTNFYIPHLKAWSNYVSPQTTLWFWNTELGWASVHNEIQKHGWVFKGCNIWNKGIAHIAGNCNGKTMKKFPVVTEVCVQYTRKEVFQIKDGTEQSIQKWMRQQWDKTGLTLNDANIACGVKNAASRKYLTKDHLWYFPPAIEFKMLTEYANKYGNPEHMSYFSLDGANSITEKQWNRLRAKFNFEYGVTNVWDESALNSRTRFKVEGTYHPSEKPLKLIKRIIDASTDIGDVIWEPFAGSAIASKYAYDSKRKFFCAEINDNYFEIIKSRFSL